MLLPLASVIAIFMAWSGYWYVADGIARREVETQRERLSRQGVALACQSESWGGYPFRFEFSCRKPVLTVADGTTIGGSALLAVAQAYNPMHIITLLDGPSTIGKPGAEARTVSHDRAIVSTIFKGGDLPQISAEVSNISAPGLFTAGDIQLHTRPAADHGNDIAVTVSSIAAMFPEKPPLAIDDVRLVGTLTRDQHYDIAEIALSSGAIKLWGKGGVSLDSERRPTGVIHAETNDPQGLLKLLDPYLELSSKERIAFESVLQLLGSDAKADIIAKNGELFIGPMKVGDLRPLDQAL